MYFNNISIKDNNPNFRRSYNEQVLYNIHKKISKEFNTDLKNNLFDNYDSYIIKKNRFPYPLYDATHYILWFNPRYNLINYNDHIKHIINKKFYNKEIKFWENAECLRTVKHIRHIHIIVKNN